MNRGNLTSKLPLITITPCFHFFLGEETATSAWSRDAGALALGGVEQYQNHGCSYCGVFTWKPQVFPVCFNTHTYIYTHMVFRAEIFFDH